MRVLVILNGVSRKRKLFYRKVYPALKQAFNAEVWETEYPKHAETLAAQASAEGFDVILAAGGDGTMHEIINGLMSIETDTSILGLIPLGSGNDLARTLGISTDAQRIIQMINDQRVTSIDVGIVKAIDDNGRFVARYFINECSMGMGPEVVRRVNQGRRGTGAGLMYLKSIIATFLFLSPEVIHVNAGVLKWSGRSRVMAIANGRTFGHGIYVAPKANPSDGIFNLFVAANPPLLRFLMLLGELKRPKESKDGCLTYSTATRVEVTSVKPLPIEADGELVGFSPMTCEVASRKVNFLC